MFFRTGLLSCLLLFSSFSLAESNDGLSECIGISVTSAMKEYSATHKTSEIPTIEVSKSDGSPSNGIDVKVVINSQISYYIVADPSFDTYGQLVGCSSASVGYSR